MPLLLSAQPTEKSSLKAHVQGLEVPHGKVAIQLCDEQGELVQEEWLFVTSNEVTFIVHDLPSGSYALKFFHDANNNGTMDRNLIGIPNESFGFSNDAPLNLGPPDLEDMLFEVDGVTEVVLNARKF